MNQTHSAKAVSLNCEDNFSKTSPKLYYG